VEAEVGRSRRGGRARHGDDLLGCYVRN
jgi:hypothetical protein